MCFQLSIFVQKSEAACLVILQKGQFLIHYFSVVKCQQELENKYGEDQNVEMNEWIHEKIGLGMNILGGSSSSTY